MPQTYRRIASLKTAEQWDDYVQQLGIQLPFDREIDPTGSLETGSLETAAMSLGTPSEVQGRVVGNRFAILPMEGWDGTPQGGTTEHTVRRWRNFGQSGAKLIWGGEAVAVEHAGRANPNQLWLHDDTKQDIANLRDVLLKAHSDSFGSADDLLLGLQLTHSGRFARPNAKDKLEPMVLYRHPVLDKKFGVADSLTVMTDTQIGDLVGKFVQAAVTSAELGYDFVDIKHCHGYLGHEFLSSIDRPGPYGGSFENRTRFLREIVQGIRSEAPGLMVGVRFSAIDWVPFEMGEGGVGHPAQFSGEEYRYAFGGDGTGLAYSLAEPIALLNLLKELEIRLVCITAGSPYYNPHYQRPAYFPPTDGYAPPEDPLIGVARHIALTAELKQACPDMFYVGSGYTYLQQWLPNVGQAAVREGKVDSVGLGRMVLSYPELPADVLAGKPMQQKKICRTFSDCTSGPRNGMISGCFPLDEFYKKMPEAKELVEIKAAFRKSM